jgi:hypothetical protein
MLDAGVGKYVELRCGGCGEEPKGSVLHLAPRAGYCDAATELARSAPSLRSLPTWCSMKATRPYAARSER